MENRPLDIKLISMDENNYFDFPEQITIISNNKQFVIKSMCDFNLRFREGSFRLFFSTILVPSEIFKLLSDVEENSIQQIEIISQSYGGSSALNNGKAVLSFATSYDTHITELNRVTEKRGSGTQKLEVVIKGGYVYDRA